MLTLRTWGTLPWSPTSSSALSSYWDMSSMEENISRRAYWRCWSLQQCHVFLTSRLLSRPSGTLLERSCSSLAASVPSSPGTAWRGSRRQGRPACLRRRTAGWLRSPVPVNNLKHFPPGTWMQGLPWAQCASSSDWCMPWTSSSPSYRDGGYSGMRRLD